MINEDALSAAAADPDLKTLTESPDRAGALREAAAVLAQVYSAPCMHTPATAGRRKSVALLLALAVVALHRAAPLRGFDPRCVGSIADALRSCLDAGAAARALARMLGEHC
jgi:hypothetical protein